MGLPNNPKELNQTDLMQVSDEIIRIAIKFCADRNLPPSCVLQVLFGATGTYGHWLNDPKVMYQAIKGFLNTTRKVYPDLVFEPGPYMEYWQRVMEEAALHEKFYATVH